MVAFHPAVLVPGEYLRSLRVDHANAGPVIDDEGGAVFALLFGMPSLVVAAPALELVAAPQAGQVRISGENGGFVHSAMPDQFHIALRSGSDARGRRAADRAQPMQCGIPGEQADNGHATQAP